VSNGLLETLRVLDVGGAESDAVSRLFADLGADVLKIEPPSGSPARRGLPSVAGASIAFALNNANKRSAVLDPDSAGDRDRFVELAGSADIVVDGGNPAGAATFGTSCAALADQFAHLVALSVTDFGTTGPHASWRATDPVRRYVDRAPYRADGEHRCCRRWGRIRDSRRAGRGWISPEAHRNTRSRDRGGQAPGSAGRRAEAVQRAVAGPAAQPADLPDISV
jgi:hypothetical protein